MSFSMTVISLTSRWQEHVSLGNIRIPYFLENAETTFLGKMQKKNHNHSDLHILRDAKKYSPTSNILEKCEESE